MANFDLSSHFSFYELTNSNKHPELVADNRAYAESKPEIMKNLKYNAGALEEIRALINVPLIISSGLRFPKLNSVAGGSTTSKHQLGLCSDAIPDGMSVQDAFKIIQANKDKLHSVRKVIIEKVNDKIWLHIQAKVLSTEPFQMFTTNDGKNFQEVV